MRGERRPGHAGPLAGWERIAIMALLAIMVGLVVLLTISASPAGQDHVGPGDGKHGGGKHGGAARAPGPAHRPDGLSAGQHRPVDRIPHQRTDRWPHVPVDAGGRHPVRAGSLDDGDGDRQRRLA